MGTQQSSEPPPAAEDAEDPDAAPLRAWDKSAKQHVPEIRVLLAGPKGLQTTFWISLTLPALTCPSPPCCLAAGKASLLESVGVRRPKEQSNEVTLKHHVLFDDTK